MCDVSFHLGILQFSSVRGILWRCFVSFYFIMANRTVTDAKSIRGTNPQYLVEKITRTRIYECKYWKEECFALTGKCMILLSLKVRNSTARATYHPTSSIYHSFSQRKTRKQKEKVGEAVGTKF